VKLFAKLKRLRAWLDTPQVSRRVQRPRRFRPSLETLEDRTLLSAGALDPTFGLNGQVITTFQSPAVSGQSPPVSGTGNEGSVAVQADGKIIEAGSAIIGGTGPGFQFFAVRYDPDGSLDTTFGTGGRAYVQFTGIDACTSVAIAGTKIILVGRSLAGGSEFEVARLNADGSLDTSFGTGGKVLFSFPGQSANVATCVAIEGSQIVVAGWTEYKKTITIPYPPYSYQIPIDDFAVARLNSDGSFDTGFGTSGQVLVDFGDQSALTSLVISVSKIVVAGNSHVVRLNADGSLDSTFGSGGKLSTGFGAYDSLAVSGTQMIIADDHGNMGRLNNDGTSDNSFGSGGSVALGFACKNLAMDGTQIVAAGDGWTVARLNSDGTFDTTFGPGGKANISWGGTSDSATSVAMDGTQILLAGTGGVGLPLARFNADGTLDTSFGTGGKISTDSPAIYSYDSFAFGAVVDSNGKIVVAGGAKVPRAISDNNGVPEFVVLRYNPDGSLDTSFGTGGKVLINFGTAGGIAYRVVMDGSEIVAVGVAGTSIAIARLNADGSLDTSFGNGGKIAISSSPGNVGGAVGVAMQGSQILLCGVLSVLSPSVVVTRVDSDGSLDASFGNGGNVVLNFGAPPYQQQASLAVVGNQILVAGSTQGTGADFAIFRLNSDGSLDSTFGNGGEFIDTGGTNNFANSIALAGTQIIVGGNSGIAQLNANGSLDTNFGVAGKVALANGIRGLAVAGSQIVVYSRLFVGRLNPDGSMDANFGSGGWASTGFSSNSINAGMALQSDGKIVIAASSDLPTSVELARYLADGSVVVPSIYISPASMPDWTLNLQGFWQTVSASQGTGPYTLALTSGSLPPGLSFNTSTGVVSGTPTAVGIFNFTITATDNLAATASRDYTITVVPTSAPVANNQNVSTLENSPLGLTLTTSSVPGAPLTYAIVTGPNHGTITGSGANLTYTPAANYYGTDSFSFQSSIGLFQSNIATVNITVNPVPIASNQSVSVLENVPLGITLAATDADGDPLTYIIVNGPTNGTLTGTGPNVTYAPAAGYTGPDNFTFKANDGSLDSNVATVSISVQTSITDNFNGPNPPSLGPNWEAPPLATQFRFTWHRRLAFGGLSQQNYEAVSDGSTFSGAQIKGLSLQNPTLQADVNAGDSQTLAVGLMARVQSDGNAYVAVLTNSGNAEIWLYQGNTQTFTVLASAAAGATSGTIQFVVNVSSLTLTFTGSGPPVVVNATDTTLTAPGGVGIFAQGPNGIIDNFSVSGS
jgi:uncharacterized delta-60 repeat protein